MNILFLGAPDFSVPSLSVLRTLDFVDIKGVVTHPDKPKGRHLVLCPPPVKLSAERYNLPLYQPERVSSPEFIKKIKGLQLDLIIVVSFGEILTKDVLAIPGLGCINLHASLLPRYRGAGPVSWALLNGENLTGVTTFWLSSKMDSGDIILQREVEVLPSDTRGGLEDRLSYIGAELLKETLIKIKDGTATRIPQDESKATYAPKIKKEDGLIDWSKPASIIHNKIRAMNPWPGAYTYINGLRVEIWDSEVIDQPSDSSSGTVVLLNEAGIGVRTEMGILLIKELQAEGKKRINAVDFVHGYRINEGQVFG